MQPNKFFAEFLMIWGNTHSVNYFFLRQDTKQNKQYNFKFVKKQKNRMKETPKC